MFMPIGNLFVTHWSCVDNLISPFCICSFDQYIQCFLLKTKIISKGEWIVNNGRIKFPDFERGLDDDLKPAL